MRIKLSKHQWESIGKRAGWVKTANDSALSDGSGDAMSPDDDMQELKQEMIALANQVATTIKGPMMVDDWNRRWVLPDSEIQAARSLWQDDMSDFVTSLNDFGIKEVENVFASVLNVLPGGSVLLDPFARLNNALFMLIEISMKDHKQSPAGIAGNMFP